jgi:cytidylate kinase
MAIITISRGSFSHGKEIAERVAQTLGYECVAREILIEAADEYQVPEAKLIQALQNAPSMRNSFSYGREKYVSFVEEAFLAHVQKDNVVYHGQAGHFFLKDIKHALKVRIIADIEDRVQLEIERKEETEGPAPPEQPMEREDLGGFSRFMKKLENVMAAAGVAAEGDSDSAAKIDPARPMDPKDIIRKEDEKRRQWSMALYGIDTADPALYDLVVHVGKFTIEDAAGLICYAAQSTQFQTTPQSQAALDDLLVAARAKAVIVNAWPGVKVTAHQGKVVVHTEATLIQEDQVRRRITEAAQAVDGVKEVRVRVELITD